MVTEIGWGSDATSSFGKGSFDAQGAQLGSAFRAYMKHRQRLKLRAVYWFSWEDLPLGSKSCSFCMETGLFDRHGDAKPAWYRLLDITHGI